MHAHTAEKKWRQRVRRGQLPQGRTVPKKPSPSRLALGKVEAVSEDTTTDQQK